VDTTRDPAALLRSREYLRLLVLATALGLPISAAAYGFLALVHLMQEWIYQDLPRGLGFDSTPTWWALPFLTVAGVLVGLVIRYLPGRGGHVPAEGFKMGGVATARDLPGVFLASLIGLGLGAVIGPEGPLIALGGGLAVLALGRSARDRPEQVVGLVAAVGSFAALATLLGSPIVGAFLLMEVVGIGGPMLGLVLVPGLLAAGIGSLIFIGLGTWSGLGALSLAVPDLPAAPSPDLAQLGWAVVIGGVGALVGTGLRWLGLSVERLAQRRTLVVTTLAGVVMGALVLGYAEATGKPPEDVLFSGQDGLGPLLTNAGAYSAGALVLLVLCKGLAYGVALGSFRGGPVFPAIMIGAAGGLALSHLPGLPTLAGAAMGIGALTVTMLRLPLTSVLLPALLLGADGIVLTPVVIVSVVVAYVVVAYLDALGQPPVRSASVGASRDARQAG
jgi:H+/Cl- antiporter ClcA